MIKKTLEYFDSFFSHKQLSTEEVIEFRKNCQLAKEKLNLDINAEKDCETLKMLLLLNDRIDHLKSIKNP
jgi:hypothetical protein